MSSLSQYPRPRAIEYVTGGYDSAATSQDYYNISYGDTLATPRVEGYSNHSIDLEGSYTLITNSPASPALASSQQMVSYWKLKDGIETLTEFPPYIFPELK